MKRILGLERRIFVMGCLAAFLGWGLVHGQVPYSKIVTTDHTTHTMGGTLFDQNGIRHGGYTNEGPSNSPQGFHLVEHYIIPNVPWSWTNQAHIYLDYAQVNSQNTSCEAYVALFYLDANNPSYHGFLPCSLFVGAGQFASLIANVTPIIEGGWDYNLQVFNANVDLDIQSKRLFGTAAMEQDFFHAEGTANNISPATDGDYYLGANRQRVFCPGGPTEPIVSKLRDDHSIVWTKDITYSNEIQGLQLDQVLGLQGGGSVLLMRSGWGPGGMVSLDANGAYVWAMDYAVDHGNFSSWPITNFALQERYTGGNELYVWCLEYHVSGHESSLIKLNATTGMPHALTGNAGQKAATYGVSGHHFAPAKIVQKSADELIVLGDYSTVGVNDYSAYIMSLRLDGGVNWCKTYNHGVNSGANGITFSADGRMWVSGSTLLGADPSHPDYENMYLLELAANGSFLSGHYYKTDSKERNATLLAPPTGDHILDGYFYSSVGGGAIVSTYRRMFTRADYDGISLRCTTIPFVPTVQSLSPVPVYENVTYHKSENMNIRVMTPDIFDINLGVSPAGCEDCNCD